MYITKSAVLRAISILQSEVHPFVGITFLACKQYALSVGGVENLSLDRLTREHLEKYHRIDRRSRYFFQPFKSAKPWVVEKYPSSGLQTINTQTFGAVFIHPRKSKKWGFREAYLEEITKILENINFHSKIPVDALAIWIYKSADVGDVDNIDVLVQKFFREFNISDAEAATLFSNRLFGSDPARHNIFISSPLEMTSVIKELPKPPDAEDEGGRTIASMKLVNVGPAAKMNIDFGSRLTIVTGDNGLGKSFLLDFAWWAATGGWADQEVIPHEAAENILPRVDYSLSTHSGQVANFSASFDRTTFSWPRPSNSMIVDALAVFSRADGSFSIADPIRARFNKTLSVTECLIAPEVWNGRQNLIEGLIRDWISWQRAEDGKTFDQFASVLKRLSPEDLGTLAPGNPVRLPGDPREIPTIQHRYGTIPVIHASSGVQRVLLLAYLIIWSWREHELAAERLRQPVLRRMMVVVDELEAHLHPKWQRIVLPALMGVGDLLSSDLAMQAIAATHSPMILASMEATFDERTDSLFHLYGAGKNVHLEEIPFVKYGDASGWLTSSLFGLQHARSREAEAAIEAAKALQLKQEAAKTEDVQSVTDQLRLYLAGDDKFWPRWLYFAEQHGVKI